MAASERLPSTPSLQERDLRILRGLLESRIMTAKHIAVLYFKGSREAAKKRLQKIKAAGLIAERIRRVNEPSILFLTRKALIVLRDEGVLSDYPGLSLRSFEKRIPVSDLTLHHELEVMDVKTAFHASISDHLQLTIAEFSTWPLLYQFETTSHAFDGTARPVKPDGFIRIHQELTNGDFAEHTYFLEVDRSSETLDTLVYRAEQYRNYFRTGGFAVRNGGRPEEFKSFPFRVLIIFKNEERRNNLAERFLRLDQPIFTLVWLSTVDQVLRNPLGPVWIQPSSYREATTGTHYDAGRTHQAFGYRRQVERDIFVREKVRKLQLLQK